MHPKSGSTDPMDSPRFMEIPTFMRTPIIPENDLRSFDIALIGVPYDGTVTNRPGARHGPREIRNSSSMMRPIHHQTCINPFELCRVGDGGDVRFPRPFVIEASHIEITRFIQRYREAGVRTICAGGDHSITLPILRAIVEAEEDRPLVLIHFDAHTDTWDEFGGSRYSHASPIRRAIEKRLVDPEHSIQIGIRGAQHTTESWDYPAAQGMRVVFMEEFTDLGAQGVIDEIRRVVGDGPVYITFDVDCLDPAFAPGTGTPEVGGMSSRESLVILRGLRGLPLVGGDVVEVAPPFDPSGNTALVGATMMYEILCLLATDKSE